MSHEEKTIHEVKTDRELEDIISTGELVLVNFSAKWCGPCKRISPGVCDLQVSNPNIKMVKCDVDICLKMADKYAIESLPTFRFFKSGNEVPELRVVGANLKSVTHSCSL